MSFLCHHILVFYTSSDLKNHHNRGQRSTTETLVWPDLTGLKLICQNKFTCVQKLFPF